MTQLSLGSKRQRRLGGLLLAGSLLAAACGGTGAEGEPGTDDEDTPDADAVEAEEAAGPPQVGGRVVYGVEAETDDGWCVAESQLAISGIQVARAVFDTLTVPDGQGGFQAHLAESVEPVDPVTPDTWVITLRDEDIRFHDGSELTAEVVKNNLDAYRGADGEHNRSPVLFQFVLQDVEDVEVTGEREVTVTMERPWAAFDAVLFASGRFGIMAQAQLDDEQTCDRNPIGTGAFELADWQLNQRTLLTRNDGYWRTDEDGTQLPYLDELEIRPMPEVQQRLNALQAGEIDAFHTTHGPTILDMEELADGDQASLVASSDFADTFYFMPNVSQPPFDDPIVREAVVLAIDSEQINEIVQLGVGDLANGPFAPGTIGNLDDTGYPQEPDPERARELVEQYEEETGERLSLRVASTPEPEIVDIVRLAGEMLEDVGIEVSTATFDQAQLIDQAIGGDFDMMTFRLISPGLDPDQHFVAWHSGDPENDETVTNPVNFPRINDPEVDRLLDEGREIGDDDERQGIYEDLNRHLGEQMYLLWGTWLVWAVPSAADVHGVVGARPVGTDGSEDYTGLANAHDPALLWREQ